MEEIVSIVAIITGIVLTLATVGAVPFAINVSSRLASLDTSQLSTCKSAEKLAIQVERLNSLLGDHERRISKLER